MDKKEHLKEVESFLDDMFEDTFENEEWELYLLLSLLNYMSWCFRWKWKNNYWFWNFLNKKNDLMVPNMLTPKWWSFRKAYICLYFIFQKLEIEVDVDFNLEKIEWFINILNKWENKKIKYETKNPLLEEFINKRNTKVFFKEPIFLFLEDKFYEWIEVKNNFDTDENIEKILRLIDEKIENFVSWELSKKYWLYSFDKQKEILLNKMAINQNILWNMFRVSEDNFWDEWNKNSFSYLHFFTFLLRQNYIKISELYSVDNIPIFDEKWDYLCENEKYSLMIYLDKSFIDLLKWWINLKEVILNKIFDKEVKNILIKKKKNWELHSLEAKMYFIWDENRFVELRKKFPNSEINTKNYKWKTQKYEVIEKTKLDNLKNKI